MSEFHSNITFGTSSKAVPSEKERWQRFADRFVRDIEEFLHDETSGHCCFCDPQECGPHIPEPGDCGQHDLWS